MLALQTAQLFNQSQVVGFAGERGERTDSPVASPQLDAPIKQSPATDNAGADPQFLHRHVDISEQAKSLFAAEQKRTEDEGASGHEGQVHDGEHNDALGDKTAELKKELVEQAEIKELKKRDREVRAHEQAHAAVGGAIAGAPTYSYTKGPDGVLYAVGGEVSISTSKVDGDPQATLQKAQKIIAAANAPAQPSSQDRAVAAQAAQMASQARVEILELRKESLQPEDEKRLGGEESKVGDEEASETKPSESKPVVGGGVPADNIAGQTAEAIVGSFIDATV